MLPEGSLKDKVVVVTGGGTGLGKAMSTMFAKLGAKVVISSRKLEVLEKTAAEMEKETGSEVLPVACDVRNHVEVEAMLNATLEKSGRVDILVNNAAGNFISPTEMLSTRAFDTIVNIVLRGTSNCTLTFGKHWIEKKQAGVILNIVTTYAWTGSGYVVPSAAAKAGVLAMTRSLAVEWGKYDIRSVAIAPGPFPTKGAWERLLPGNLAEKFDMKKKVPLGRVGEHGELANLAAFMVSDYAAYINGEVITIDGGEWLKGAGEFNMLEEIPQELWDQYQQMIKSTKGS